MMDRLLEKVCSIGITKKQEGDVEIVMDGSDSDFLQKLPPPLDKV